jgi:hypothetical protein
MAAEFLPPPDGLGVFPLPMTLGCPLIRGFELSPSLWLGVSPSPSGSGFPLCRLPFPVVKKFLRLSGGPHKGVTAVIFEIFGRPQVIHS